MSASHRKGWFVGGGSLLLAAALTACSSASTGEAKTASTSSRSTTSEISSASPEAPPALVPPPADGGWPAKYQGTALCSLLSPDDLRPMENYGAKQRPIFTPNTVPRAEWSSMEQYGDKCRYKYPGTEGAEDNQVLLWRFPDQKTALRPFDERAPAIESVSGYEAILSSAGYADIKVGTDVVHTEVFVFLDGTSDNNVSDELSRKLVTAIAEHLRAAS